MRGYVPTRIVARLRRQAAKGRREVRVATPPYQQTVGNLPSAASCGGLPAVQSRCTASRTSGAPDVARTQTREEWVPWERSGPPAFLQEEKWVAPFALFTVTVTLPFREAFGGWVFGSERFLERLRELAGPVVCDPPTPRRDNSPDAMPKPSSGQCRNTTAWTDQHWPSAEIPTSLAPSLPGSAAATAKSRSANSPPYLACLVPTAFPT